MEQAFVSRLRRLVTHRYKGREYYTYVITVPIRLARQLREGEKYVVIIKECEEGECA